jgi:uncharacterized membrane protein YgcG
MKRMNFGRHLSQHTCNVENWREASLPGALSGPDVREAVVRRDTTRARRLVAILLAVLVVMAVIVPVPSAQAAVSKPQITDTQNLLGAQGSAIQEKVDALQKDTGVTLNLLFVDSFNLKKLDKTTISKWVNARLDFTKPAKNTLLLAVASQDGQMALAVSKGSDSWLASQVDTTLSDAAAAPLARKNPNWTGSVTALIAAVRQAKADHDALPWKIAGGIAIALVVVGLVVGLVFLIRHLRRKGFFTSHAGRHAVAKPEKKPHGRKKPTHAA